MPNPARNIIRQKDLRIAKLGKENKPIPCSQIFSSYLEHLRLGHESNVPNSIIKALHECGEQWQASSRQQGAGVNYQLSLFKKQKS
mmetsp:Transcript_8773/g.9290  ORF Transcript_8773/g.9290 Transcript_8773/m.9290 type:complete len:86 (-) Transcript_8773:107-364(-)